jgi:uncharacterized protein (TIGR02147 family)
MINIASYLTVMNTIFEFDEYRAYLANRLPTTGTKRGLRARLAESLKVRPAFVSQVLQARNELSPEHVVLVNEFLQHDDFESEYFMLLCNFSRAGSDKLRVFYKKQITRWQKSRLEIKTKIQSRIDISVEDQAKYCSSWQHAATHVLAMIPHFQSIGAISDRLKIDRKDIVQSVQMLSSIGLVEQSGDSVKATEQRFHISHDSPFVSFQHLGWRNLAMSRVVRPDGRGLHYSGALSLSRADAERVRKVILDMISSTEKILKDSPDEEAMTIVLDYFPL